MVRWGRPEEKRNQGPAAIDGPFTGYGENELDVILPGVFGFQNTADSAEKLHSIRPWIGKSLGLEQHASLSVLTVGWTGFIV